MLEAWGQKKCHPFEKQQKGQSVEAWEGEIKLQNLARLPCKPHEGWKGHGHGPLRMGNHKVKDGLSGLQLTFAIKLHCSPLFTAGSHAS